MAGSNNFKVFNESLANIMDDTAYDASTYRQNGAISGIAPSNLHNKLYRQTSIMAAALAQVFANHNIDMSDANFNNLVAALEKGICEDLWKPNTAYTVGEVRRHPSLPSWAYLECTQAGTSGNDETIFTGISNGGGNQ